MGEFIKVAMVGDIAPGEARGVEAGGKRIALFNIDGTFYAIDDTCTHRCGPLSEGMVMGAEVTCPWHRALFDVTSGAVLGAPAPARRRPLRRTSRRRRHQSRTLSLEHQIGQPCELLQEFKVAAGQMFAFPERPTHIEIS